MASILQSIFSKRVFGTACQIVSLCALAAVAAVSTDQALRVRRARREADAAKPRRPYQYRALRAQRRVLIVGDSTGVGIGADCATQSIAGLLAAEYPGAEVVNLSVSGSTLDDVPAQLRRLATSPGAPRFDVVLLHVGGNDILHTQNLTAMQQAAEALMPQLHRLAQRVIWIGPGDVGLAPLFRPPFSWWISRRCAQACAMFERTARAHDVEFVGFHGEQHRDILARDRHLFFAQDGFHPNAHGYRYCYGWLSRSSAMKHLQAQRRLRAISHAGEAAPHQSDPISIAALSRIERWPSGSTAARSGDPVTP